MQTTQVNNTQRRFNGPVYDPAKDNQRLEKQIGRVFDIMKDGKKRSLQRIQADIESKHKIKDPESSISAQLRHLKKPRFGGYTVNKERATDGGTWVYWLEVVLV